MFFIIMQLQCRGLQRYATKDPKCHKSMCLSISFINRIQVLRSISSWNLLTASWEIYNFRVKLVLHSLIWLS